MTEPTGVPLTEMGRVVSTAGCEGAGLQRDLAGPEAPF